MGNRPLKKPSALIFLTLTSFRVIDIASKETDHLKSVAWGGVKMPLKKIPAKETRLKKINPSSLVTKKIIQAD